MSEIITKIEELEKRIKEIETRIGMLENMVAIALISSGLYILEKIKKETEKEEKHE